jgi:hypothetical protein
MAVLVSPCNIIFSGGQVFNYMVRTSRACGVFKILHFTIVSYTESCVKHFSFFPCSSVANHHTLKALAHVGGRSFEFCDKFSLFFHSSVANRHTLKALARVGAGSFEFYDSKFKSKWEDKVGLLAIIKVAVTCAGM